MSETPKTAGERIIENIMQQLDPSSERYQVLNVAKRFKSSWVELGEQLLKVNSQQLFQQWGYASFEEYCSKEVRIKKPTAQKLTLAYRFMEKEEPDLMARRTELKPLPDYRSVDLLRQAREEKNFSPDEYAQLRQAVVEEERSHPTVLKQFKEVGATKEPEDDNPLPHVKACLSTSRRLETGLRTLPEAPAELARNVEALTGWLEGELARLTQEQS